MKPGANQNKYNSFRESHPVFSYDSCEYSIDSGILTAKFAFSCGQHSLKSSYEFPDFSAGTEIMSDPHLASLVFHLGMVEMISYWKAFCSPIIELRPYCLNPDQQQWWKNLFFNGLGEFFYTNGIRPDPREFLNFRNAPDAAELPESKHAYADPNAVIVPVGGGKDSVVGLELLLHAGMKPYTLVINPREATKRVIDIAGIPPDRQITVGRRLDPQILELNKQGYLNGHTPFSAMLAFASLIVAYISGTGHIALSNESSANEPSIPGTGINHQYSKSFGFESDFRRYTGQYLIKGISYFSLLRPLNELQIAAFFAKYEAYHRAFRSCNAGSKIDAWCGACPKCLFTRIVLDPFLSKEHLRKVFGRELFEDTGLIPLLEQMSGKSANKPFECVGTLDEVNAALAHSLRRMPGGSRAAPALQAHFRDHIMPKTANLPVGATAEDVAGAVPRLETLLAAWNQEHFLEPRFENLLKEAMKSISLP